MKKSETRDTLILPTHLVYSYAINLNGIVLPLVPCQYTDGISLARHPFRDKTHLALSPSNMPGLPFCD